MAPAGAASGWICSDAMLGAGGTVGTISAGPEGSIWASILTRHVQEPRPRRRRDTARQSRGAAGVCLSRVGTSSALHDSQCCLPERSRGRVGLVWFAGRAIDTQSESVNCQEEVPPG